MNVNPLNRAADQVAVPFLEFIKGLLRLFTPGAIGLGLFQTAFHGLQFVGKLFLGLSQIPLTRFTGIRHFKFLCRGHRPATIDQAAKIIIFISGSEPGIDAGRPAIPDATGCERKRLY
jgi:hypothetical protein